MQLNKIIFLLLSLSSLASGIYLQFYYASLFNGELISYFILGVTICGVMITVSTSGIGSFLISEFVKINSGEKLYLKEALLGFLILFSALSLVACIAIALIGFFSLKIEIYSAFLTAFLFACYLIALSLNIILQSYSYTQSGIKSEVAYEFLSFLSYAAIFIMIAFFMGEEKSYLFYISLFCLRPYIQIIIYLFLVQREFHITPCSFAKVFAFLGRIKIIISGSAYYKSEPIVDRLLLINNSDGMVAFHLINQIYTAALGLWFKIAVSPWLRKLASLDKDHTDYKKIFSQGLLTQLIPITGGAAFVFMIFLIKPFQENSSLNIIYANSCQVYILFLFFTASLFGQIISNAFYAISYHRIPIIVSCVTFTIFLPVKYLLVNSYGVIGLCFLVSAYHSINGLILYFLLKRQQVV